MTHETVRIAVVFATSQGSTREIADYIGAALANRGADVEVADVAHAPELSRFDAVILGSAVHNMDVLPEMSEFVRSHRYELAATNVWLFTVGLGPALRGPIGRRMGRIVPPKIAALRDSIHPVGYRAFAGHFENVGVSLKARIIYRLLGGGRFGDLRDWPAIGEWTATIGRILLLPQPAANIAYP